MSPPATVGAEPIRRHPDYTPKPTSIPSLCLNAKFYIRQWSDKVYRILISCNPVRSSPRKPAEPGLFKCTALLAEDEGLQLEDSTVVHHFPFYRAKSCPSDSYLYTYEAERNPDASYTNRNPLISMSIPPLSEHSEGEGVSMYKIKASAEEGCNFFLLQVFMALLLVFSSKDWKLCGREIKTKKKSWSGKVRLQVSLFYIPGKKTGRRRSRNWKEGIDTKTFRWNMPSEKHLSQSKISPGKSNWEKSTCVAPICYPAWEIKSLHQWSFTPKSCKANIVQWRTWPESQHLHQGLEHPVLPEDNGRQKPTLSP